MDFPGSQAALPGRYYFRNERPGGLYPQAAAGRLSHSGQVRSFYPGLTLPPSTRRFTGCGPGLALGYRWLLGGPRLTLNTASGVRFYLSSLGMCDCGYVRNFNDAGQPGSPLDTQVGLLVPGSRGSLRHYQPVVARVRVHVNAVVERHGADNFALVGRRDAGLLRVGAPQVGRAV